jgi:hypothetical protein
VVHSEAMNGVNVHSFQTGAGLRDPGLTGQAAWLVHAMFLIALRGAGGGAIHGPAWWQQINGEGYGSGVRMDVPFAGRGPWQHLRSSQRE